MNLEDKIKGYVGLAARAGRLVSGEDQIIKAAQTGKARRLLVDEDAGKNTRDRMERLARHYDLELSFLHGLGNAIGRPERKAAALTDEGLEKAILRTINEFRGGVLEE